MYWNWNRIKLAFVLLFALWANQPVSWARVRPASPPGIERAVGLYGPAPLEPGNTLTPTGEMPPKTTMAPVAAPNFESSELALASVELAKIEKLIALENEMLRAVENELALAQGQVPGVSGAISPQMLMAQHLEKIQKVKEERLLLEAMREQANLLHIKARQRLEVLVGAAGRKQGQVTVCVWK